MIKFKHGIWADNLTSEVCRIINVANEEFAKFGYDFVITSLGDGRHMKGSKHYCAKAADGRTRNVGAIHQEEISHNIQRRLGDDYDVVLHKKSKKSPGHLHMEHDPK